MPPDSYGTNHSTLIASVRAGNVIGGGDWSQDRLIPDIAKATAKGENVVIRNPGAVRPWQHVLECLSGYLTVGAQLLRERVECGDAFNFGPDADDAISVGQMVAQMKKYWPDIRSCAHAQADAPHEAGYLKLDCAKARHYFDWRPVWGCDTALELTAQWYRDFYKTAAVNSSDNLHRYIEEARRKEAVWTK
jgi:CDP-glucose 4,6-dehydratase